MKFCYAIGYGFIILLASYLGFVVFGASLFWIYDALIEWFPTVFEDYSPVLEADLYQRSQNIISVTATICAVFFASVIVTRLDNSRDEFMIKKTEGFYKIPEILPFYYSNYILPDLFASLTVTAVISGLAIPAHLITFTEKSWFSNAVDSFKGFHIGFLYEEWEFFVAIPAVFLMFFLSKLIAGIHGLKKWRAAWLAYN